MNYRMIARIGCRFIAIYLFMTYLTFLPGSIVSLLGIRDPASEGDHYQMLAAILPMVVILILSTALWISADKLSRHITGEIESDAASAHSDYESFQYVVFSLVGVLVLAKAFPDLLSTVVQTIWLTSQNLIHSGDRNYINYMGKIIGQTLQVVISIWLLVGTKGIIKFIRVMRTAGVTDRDNSQ